MRAVLAQAEVPLDRHSILAEWPADRRRPNQATLWRWPEQAVAAGLVRADGTGRKGSPFRYRLVETPEE